MKMISMHQTYPYFIPINFWKNCVRPKLIAKGLMDFLFLLIQTTAKVDFQMFLAVSLYCRSAAEPDVVVKGLLITEYVVALQTNVGEYSCRVHLRKL